MLSETRPSALLSACTPAAIAQPAQVYALGHAAVSIRISARLVPAFAGFTGTTVHSSTIYDSTIHNSMGSTSAKGEGTTLPIIDDQKLAVRDRMVEIVKVMGGDARGIPPRGVPV